MLKERRLYQIMKTPATAQNFVLFLVKGLIIRYTWMQSSVQWTYGHDFHRIRVKCERNTDNLLFEHDALFLLFL